MANNADTLVALCRLIISDTPHSEVNVAVVMAELKAEHAADPRGGDDGLPLSVVAMAVVSDMFDEIVKDAESRRNAECQNSNTLPLV